MMVEPSRKYHAHVGNYTPGGNSHRYIVVHNTANIASAKSEARYAQNNQHESSYHYVLDGRGCYQLLDDTDTAWAVGAWPGARQLVGNGESISIEVCSPGVEFTAAERDQLRSLVRRLMGAHGIPASHVVRHYDCHTGRKPCPAWYVDGGRWDELHSYITEEDDDMTDKQFAKIIDELKRTRLNQATIHKDLVALIAAIKGLGK